MPYNNFAKGVKVMKLYAVINIDIVGSRHLNNRQVVQEYIKTCIKTLDSEFKSIIAAPITITLGDEWQIILKKPSKSCIVINSFQTMLIKENIHIYAGIGIGTISTKIYRDTRLMDGECFIRARNAINIIKKKNRFYNKEINSKRNNVYFNGEEILIYQRFDNIKKDEVSKNIDLNKVINTIIENNEVLKNRTTAKQQEVMELYEKLGSYNNIVKVSNSITKSDISQKLNGADYFVINNNYIVIEDLLELYCESREEDY